MTIPPVPHLLVLLRTPALPDATALREALVEAGMAVHALNPLLGEDAGFAVTWLTEDGPEGARIQLRIGAPSMLALNAPGAVPEEEVDAAAAHILVALDEATPEPLAGDGALVHLGLAILPLIDAIGARMGHTRVWHPPEAWEEARAQVDEGELPSALLVDRTVGRVSADAAGVLSSGLDRYGVDEVFLVGDRDRLEELFEVSGRVVHAALHLEESPLDLHPGPHPAQPGETVRVGFLDE